MAELRKLIDDLESLETTMIFYKHKIEAKTIRDAINQIIKPVKSKSKWIVNTKKYGTNDYHCILCGAIVEKDEAGRHYWQYCYHCGAFMELMDGTDRDYDKDGEQE